MKFAARHLAALGAGAMVLGNVGRIPAGMLGGRTAPFVVADVVTLMVWIALAVALLTRRVRATLDDISLPVMAFIAIAGLGTALGIHRYGLGFSEAMGTTAFLVRWVFYFGWYLFVAWCLTPDEARSAWRYVEVAVLAFAAFGILQSAFLPGFAQRVQSDPNLPTWDLQGHRLVSTMLDPNLAGILIVIVLLVRLAHVAESGEKRTNGFELLLLAAALLLTVSRSSVLALAVGLVAIVAMRGVRSRFSYVVLVGFALAVPALVLMSGYLATLNKLQLDSSALERLIPWSRAVALVMEHPLLGVGFNAVSHAEQAHGWVLIGSAGVSLDGGLLFIGAMTGALGLVAYCWMLRNVVRVARWVYLDRTRDAADRALGVGAVASTAAVLVHSLFVNSLLLPFVMQMLWVLWAMLMRIASDRRIRAASAVAIVPLLVLITGCDPCTGTNVCARVSRVDLIGQMVDAKTGTPVPGARVKATLGSGGQDTAVTGVDGGWEIAIDVGSSDSVPVSVEVAAPGQGAYTTPPIMVKPVQRRGDATLLGAWLNHPYTRYLGTLTYQGALLKGARVDFTRTAGVVATGNLSATTNEFGIFEMDVASAEPGDMIGKLHVTQTALGVASTMAGYIIPLNYRFAVAKSQAINNVGGLLTYGGQAFFRGTGQHIKGVKVTWTRTGGIQTTPATRTMTTTPTGFFLLDLRSADSGTTVGTLSITPPSGPGAPYANLRLTTYDSAYFRYLGNFPYGERWAWTLQLERNDSLIPATGVPVTFRRTGGISLDPSEFTRTTGTDGRILLQASVGDTGFVDGELTVHQATGPARVITGLHLRTFAANTTYVAGVRGFGPSLRYRAQIQQANGTPVVGATVTFTRESGLAATPAVFTATTDSVGAFDLVLYPPSNTDGTVVGHLNVIPPAPYPAGSQYTIGGVQLTTFESLEPRVAGPFQIPDP